MSLLKNDECGYNFDSSVSTTSALPVVAQVPRTNTTWIESENPVLGILLVADLLYFVKIWKITGTILTIQAVPLLHCLRWGKCREPIQHELLTSISAYQSHLLFASSSLQRTVCVQCIEIIFKAQFYEFMFHFSQFLPRMPATISLFMKFGYLTIDGAEVSKSGTKRPWWYVWFGKVHVF